MCYWPALTANLAECQLPLLEWLERVAGPGAQVAREFYGAPGWVLHHNSDLWGFAAPVGEGHDDASWSCWPLGGTWLARQALAVPEVLGDDQLLARTWRAVRGAVEFALWWLVEQPDGSVGTSPSTSPENLWRDADGRPWALTRSSTSDVELLRDLFDGVLAVAGGVAPPDLLARVRTALDRLPAPGVLPDGRLAEWGDGAPDVDPRHRHQSHLVGVFPGRATLLEPRLTEAARTSLASRGEESTGWSLAWRLALWARLGDAGRVRALAQRFLRPVEPVLATQDPPEHSGGVYRNLLSAHPPFQLDGNLGFTAGVVEALLQSHETTAEGRLLLRVLPACPWPRGRVQGLRARGGVVVGVDWAPGAAAVVTVSCPHGARLLLDHAGRRTLVDLLPGEERTLALAPAPAVAGVGAPR